MKDYVVRIARLGDILIRAASAEEAASMAARFGSASWDNFELRVEVARNGANQNDECVNTDAKVKDGKKRKAKKRKSFCVMEDEIPF